MKKLLVSIFAMLLCAFSLNAQEVPQYTMPSPTAYQLAKYGDIPVNESTGIANVGIPILGLKTGNLSTSVNLSYTTSGIKVDQVASWVGLGWNLNAGGVITRSVRGTADESASSRPFTTYSAVQNWQNATDKTAFVNFVNAVNAAYDDYEPDVFNFNFDGYSGSFYLDSNLNPKLIKRNHELKIERISDTNTGKMSFSITTPLGVKYYFGDATNDKGIEYSKAISYAGQAHGEPALNLPTSWFIIKITHPNGDEMYFDYDYLANYTLTTGFNQEYKKILYQVKVNECADIPEGLTTNSYGNVMQTIKLSKISSNRTNETINFHATKSRSDLPGEYKLDSISLKKGTTTIKSYGLDYSFITSSINYYGASGISWLTNIEHKTRMYLDKVYEKDNQGNTSNGKEHLFDYEDRNNLPPRMSFSQDLLGFYNGEINNSFLPDNVDTNYSNFSAIQRGDRSSNFNYAKKGLLTTITYPTKGTTTLEYEPAIELVTTSYNNRSNFSMDVNNSNGTSVYTQDFTSAYNQAIEVKPDLIIISGTDIIHDIATITIKNKTTNQEVFNQNIRHNTTGSFIANLDANITYEVKISMQTYEDDEMRTTLNFDYISSVSTSTSPENKTGIRIKKIINKASASAPEEITRYYYTNKENLTASSFKELRAFNFIEVDTGINGNNCQQTDWGLFHQYTQVKLKSNSLTHYRRLLSEQILYETVVMSKGDNFEGGGVEKHFQVHLAPENFMIHGQQIYNSTRTNQYDIENGTLTKEIAFIKEGNTISDVSEKRYVYKIDQNKSSSFDAYTSNFRFEQHQITNNIIAEIDGIDVGVYQFHYKWISLDSVITKQYFGNNTITSKQKYLYSTGLAGLPTEITNINSKGDTIKTKNFYPGNVNYIYDLGFDNLTTDEKGAIDRMKDYDLHMIGTPIQTQTYKNGTLLSTQRTNYYEYFTDKIFVKDIQSASMSSSILEDRVLFHSYDSIGNPKEVSKKDGTHVVYIWGYNKTVPIAKIENATYADVTSYVSNLQTLSNADNDRTFGTSGNEGALRAALETMRSNLTNAQVTYYTYDPLIGITSITDPRGKTMYYLYDSFNRLQYIKDNEGNILSENQYNYKN